MHPHSQLTLFPMTNRRERTKERNTKIREAFASYDRKKYTLDWVLQQVADKFYLSADTVYAIVKEIGRYTPPKGPENN